MGLNRGLRIMRLGSNKQAGFTLLELMVVVAMAAILASLAGPSFKKSIDRNNINKAARDMRTSLTLARDAALTRVTTVRMCASSDHATCTGAYRAGWLIYIDTNGDATLSSGEEVLRSFEGVSSNINITATAAAGFNSRGYATNAATFKFCDTTNNATISQALEITVAGVVSPLARGTYTCP